MLRLTVTQLAIRIAAAYATVGLVVACGVDARDSRDEPGLSDDVGVARSELRKGTPGAQMGQSNYCDDSAHPCVAGEGDCDSSSQCEPGSICSRGKLLQFGFPGGDACVPGHCANKLRDVDETQIDCGGSCGTVCAPPVCRENGVSTRCNSDCLCGIGEGDCDSNTECLAPLVCGRGKLTQFGFSGGDGCVPAHCTNELRDADETQIDCGGSCGTVCAPPVCRENGVSTRCNSDCLCGIGEGDCDSNTECLAPLVCGHGKLSQFGFSGGDACVPAHCANARRDESETGIDCGGECGSVACPARGCLTSAVYDIQLNGSYTEKWPQEAGGCSTWSGSYQRSLEATVVSGAVEVVGWGFDGRYPIIEETAAGFKAQAGSFYAFACGDAYPDLDNSGLVTLTFTCTTSAVEFDASCISDAGADGCYPNYAETATGMGTRSFDCPAGYVVSDHTCADVDECAGSPCDGAETCLNTPGSFSCVCSAPAEVCSGQCVKPDVDFANCGACGRSCTDGETCAEGACIPLSCPAGYRSAGGICVDVDECATSASPCSANATCTNTPGSFACSCRSGYSGDGMTCTDIDECASSPCRGAETCTNLAGSHTCSCNSPALTCGSQCIDVTSDTQNCGACGQVCDANETCAAALCVTATCPGNGGPEMVAVPQDYCIDSTEVTRSQYAEWLATSPVTGAQDPATCGWNTSFEPDCPYDSGYWPPADKANQPVVCVDWCDAFAYCAAVGKRLCGRPGGGSASFVLRNDSSLSQWFNACSSHGLYAYPYGGTLQPTACNGRQLGAGTTRDVASLPLCQSPSASYAGVFDLSGNASEWEDSCSAIAPTALCRLRGESYTGDVLSCATNSASIRNSREVSIGFRCCADL